MTPTPAAAKPDKPASAFDRRLAEWSPQFPASTPHQQWLLAQVVHGSLAVDRCQATESARRDHLCRRAALCWDDDRRLAAEEIGDKLSRRPALVTRRLMATRQGCDWLISRWTALGALLQSHGEWTDAQLALARNLLGTPLELCDAPTRLDPPAGQDAVAFRAAVVSEQVAGLNRKKAAMLNDLDAIEQDMAARGMNHDADPALARLRRHESAARRQMQWAQRLLQPPEPSPLPVDLNDVLPRPYRVTAVGAELDAMVTAMLATNGQPGPPIVPTRSPLPTAVLSVSASRR